MDVSADLAHQEKRRSMMLNAPLPILVTKMALPTIISMLVMSFYNLTDTYFVSSLGTAATGAVGINNSLMSFIQMGGSALAVGANSYIARLLGAKQDEKASQVLAVAFFSAMILGAIIMVFGLTFIEDLVKVMGAKDDAVIKYSIDYASYILYAAPLMTAAFVLNQCLRAEGSAFFSMIGMVCGAFLNLILDPIFIFIFHWEVAGAAAATAISKLVSFCVLLTPYFRKSTILTVNIKKFKFTKDIVSEISKMGFPTLMRSFLMTLANVLTNNIASVFGVAALAAVSVVNRIMMFITSAILGFGQGYQPVAGFNWGAKQYDRVRKAFRFSSIAGVSAISVISVLFAVFAPWFIGLFTTDTEALKIGIFSMRLQCYAMPIQAWVIVVNMTYAGLGKPLGAALISLSRQGICFIPVVLIFSNIFGVMGLAASQAVADLLSLIIAIPFAIMFIKEIRKLALAPKPLKEGES